MSDKQPPPFRMTYEEYTELATEVRDIVNRRTSDFATATSAVLSMAASMMEAYLVATGQWNVEKILSTKDIFAVNLLRSHDLRIAQEGSEPIAVRAEDVIGTETKVDPKRMDS